MLEKQVAMNLHSVSISKCSFAFDANRVAKNTQHSCVTQFWEMICAIYTQDKLKALVKIKTVIDFAYCFGLLLLHSNAWKSNPLKRRTVF